jgi:hypothetical protein
MQNFEKIASLFGLEFVDDGSSLSSASGPKRTFALQKPGEFCNVLSVKYKVVGMMVTLYIFIDDDYSWNEDCKFDMLFNSGCKSLNNLFYKLVEKLREDEVFEEIGENPFLYML